jgi:hypothetical protein
MFDLEMELTSSHLTAFGKINLPRIMREKANRYRKKY